MVTGGIVYLTETAEQQALRKELREYFAELLTPEARAELGAAGEGSPLFREICRRMGADGWLGLGWPEEFGGQGRPATDQFIFFDEVQRAHAPFPFVTVNTVGPALMAHGTAEQKATFLPAILRGEVNFAIGYTEPEAGTDLASLRTSAVLDGDEWVINGNKVYTSGANQADYIWLAARTDVEAPKHAGISIIIVPTDSPGFSWTPITTVGDVMTTATYYSDVRVPVGNVVGELNAGWRLITMQLNHERVGLAALSGLTQRLVEDVTDWAKVTPLDGTADGGACVIDVPWVQADLARCHALLDATRLMTWKLVKAVSDNTLGPAEASGVKVFGTESAVEVYRLLQGILGAAAVVRDGSPGAVLHGEVERAARAAQINTFGGGVNEIQRELVATAGLGLVRGRR
jgi:3-oxocholest-4-en-26-oyl-CoA dehydrogenase alpha subunit